MFVFLESKFSAISLQTVIFFQFSTEVIQQNKHKRSKKITTSQKIRKSKK